MNIERASELKREARSTLNYAELHWLMYDEDTYDMEDPDTDGPDLLPGVTSDDSWALGQAEQALAWAGTQPGQSYVIYGEEGIRAPDPERGERPHLPSLTLTEGLALARHHLAQLRIGAKPDLVDTAQRTLALVNEALVALDLAPDDPVLQRLVEAHLPHGE